MKNKKPAYFIFIITFMLFWVLGFLRFESQIALFLFKFALFPFGFLYYLFETHTLVSLPSDHWLNDEILQLVIFLAAVAGQTFVYLFIYNYGKKLLNR